MVVATQVIEREMVPQVTQVQDTDPTLYSQEFLWGGVLDIDMTAVAVKSGTATVLDLTLQGYDETALAWYDITTFTQIVASGTTHKVYLESDGVLPKRLRLKRVVSGGTAVAAVADVDPQGTNNRMDWTAKGAWLGVAGNTRFVEYLNDHPEGGGALSVELLGDGVTIAVHLATDTDAVAAVKNVDPSGTQNALDWTAKTKGTSKNGKTVTYVAGAASGALAIAVDGSENVTVTLAMDAGTLGAKTVDPTGLNNSVDYTEVTPGYMTSIAYTLAVTASAPLSAAESSAGVIVATLPTDAGVKAYRDIGPTGGQIRLRCRAVGTAGNSGTVTIVAGSTGDPTSAALATVDDVTITLGKDAYGTIVANGNDVIQALMGNAAIAAYFEYALIAGADLTLPWATDTVRSLAGGLAPALVAASATANLVRAAIDLLGKTTSANHAGNDGTGAVAVVTAQAFSGAVAPAVTTIASDIDAIAAATPAVDALYAVANHAGNDGTGLVTAMTAQALAGGTDATILSTAANIKTASDATPAVFALITPTNHAGNDGSGVVTAMAPVALAGGADRSYAYKVGAVMRTV